MEESKTGGSEEQVASLPSTTLIGIGFWKDPKGEDEFRHPAAFVDETWALEERKAVAKYLRSGTRAINYLGHSWCRFRCGIQGSKMGSADLTDGIWVWPEGLHHYVLAHSVRLPEAFLDHARERRYKARRHRFARFSDHTHELEYWINWCRANANPSTGYRKLERIERADVLKARRRALAEQCRKLESELGVSEEACIWRHCRRHALRQRAHCARHSIGTNLPGGYFGWVTLSGPNSR